MKAIAFVITAGHLDIEWYQPLRSYRFWTVRALEELRHIDATRPDFRTYVLDGQYYPLQEYLQVMPQNREAMRDLVARRRLAIGPFFTQFDEWLPSAESMIRNCLYGDRRCRAFGRPMRAGYLPDNFGHPLQMPQILRGFGIDSLLFMRGMPEVLGGHDDEFAYVGLDGSTLFASHFRESYSGAFDIFNRPILPSQPRSVPYYADFLSYEHHLELAEHDDPQRIARNMVENVRRLLPRYPSRVVPLVAGYDHLPPQAGIGSSVKAANEMQDEVEFVMGDVEEYVRLAQSRLPDGPRQSRSFELTGSRYQFVLLGALSARTYLKREHFACEALMERYAEPLDALAGLYGHPHAQTLFDEAWEAIMVNSAHDSIHGSSVDEVHVEMQARYGAARQIAAGIVHESLAHLAAVLPAWGGRRDEILAVSPVSGKAQPVTLWVPTPEGTDSATARLAVVDASGAASPAQVIPPEPIPLNGRGDPRHDPFPGRQFTQILFQGDFEAYAPKTYRVVPADALPPAAPAVLAGDGPLPHLENALLRVEADGALLRIVDKRSGWTVTGLNLLEEDADAGDPWDYAAPWTPGEVVHSSDVPFSARVVESGPVRATLELCATLSVPKRLEGDVRSAERTDIPLSFVISLRADSPCVEVRLTLDNSAEDHRIRLRIPSPVRTASVRSQGHLAVLDRAVERPVEIEPWAQPPTRLLPCREWIAVEDDAHGLAVALKGMYDYEAIPDPETGRPDLCVTLLRGFGCMNRCHTATREGAAAPSVPTPGAQCPGRHVMEWAFIPYAPSRDDKAPFLPAAQTFLYPPVAHAVRAPHTAATDVRPAFTLPGKPANICFSAFKKAFDDDSLVLRFYENQGIRTRVCLHVDDRFSQVVPARLDERPAGDALPWATPHEVELDFAPFKAVTLLLRR